MSAVQFECCVCNISLPVQYQGTNPPFLPGILYSICFYNKIIIFSFKEEVFIMKPISNDSMHTPVGGICNECKKPCCLQPACSSVSNKDGFVCLIIDYL